MEKGSDAVRVPGIVLGLWKVLRIICGFIDGWMKKLKLEVSGNTDLTSQRMGVGERGFQCKYVKIHESANENGNVETVRSLEYVPQR